MFYLTQRKIKLEKAYEQLVGKAFFGTYMWTYDEMLSDLRDEKTIEIEFVSKDEYNLLYRGRFFEDGKESSDEESFTENRKYHLGTRGGKIYINFDCSSDSLLNSREPFIIYFDENNEITEISTSDFSSGVGLKLEISDKGGIAIPSSQGSATAD